MRREPRAVSVQVTRIDTLFNISGGSGFRFWRGFRCCSTSTGICRLLRWLSKDAVARGFAGEVGLVPGCSGVRLTDSRLVVTALCGTVDQGVV